jgi:Sulfotransferase domain
MTEQNNGEQAQNAGARQVDAKQTDTKKRPTTAYRRLRRKFVQTPLRAPLVWLRHRNLQPADVFFGAYPKSGTTYIRFVLFEMLSGMPAGFKATNHLMAGIGHHQKAMRLLPGGGRLIATHEHYRKDYRRAIYVVRDGRDVLLSEYAFLNALEFYRKDLNSFVSHFLFTSVSAYGPWHKHVAGWLDSPIAGTDNMLLVRFEDLRKDPVPWFARMADFLGVHVSEEKIKIAVENNSIQKMRAKEDREPVRASVKGRFVRDGAVRGWVSKLTPEQVLLFEKHAGSALVRLGYPLSSHLESQLSREARPVAVAMNQIRETAIASD